MSLCFFSLMAGPLLLSLGWMQLRFTELYNWERSLIALDNAAVVLGRAERSVLGDLAKANRELQHRDLAHHPWHACARVPATAAKCLPVDRTAEQALSAVWHRHWAQAVARWRQAEGEARLQTVGAPGKVDWSRSALPPVRPRRCSQCGAWTGWERVEAPPTQVVLRWESRVQRLAVRVQGQWQHEPLRYSVREVAGAVP
ncbi:hypothetical protein K2X33_12710 [bacterium]|nr:hypothetical protein [bacterium]